MVNRRSLRQIFQQRHGEADIINVVIAGITATAPGMPSQQSPTETPCAIWIDGEKTFTVSNGVKRSPGFVSLGAGAAAVKTEDDRQRLSIRRLRGNVDKIRSHQIIGDDGQIMVARSERSSLRQRFGLAKPDEKEPR
jgi:hypothetical protein